MVSNSETVRKDVLKIKYNIDTTKELTLETFFKNCLMN